MARRRRLQAQIEVLRQWIVWCQKRCQKRDYKRARQDPAADQREALFAEPPQLTGDVCNHLKHGKLASPYLEALAKGWSTPLGLNGKYISAFICG